MCDRQSILRYMTRCGKQSTITSTSLGQMIQFLKCKLCVQKCSMTNMLPGCDKDSTMLISMIYHSN